MNHHFRIALFHPEIPQNTGNIVRTCRATNTPLTLIKPLGFQINDRQVKRAGLDYWDEVQIETIDRPQFETMINQINQPVYFFTSKTSRSFWDVDYTKGATLVFGSETKGLPEEYYKLYETQLVTIPMAAGARCLNLSNSVAIALYEALRVTHKKGN